MAQLHFHVQTITLHHPIVCSRVSDENMLVNTKYAKFSFFLQNSPANFHSFEVVWSLIVDSFGVSDQDMQIKVEVDLSPSLCLMYSPWSYHQNELLINSLHPPQPEIWLIKALHLRKRLWYLCLDEESSE